MWIILGKININMPSFFLFFCIPSRENELFFICAINWFNQLKCFPFWIFDLEFGTLVISTILVLYMKADHYLSKQNTRLNVISSGLNGLIISAKSKTRFPHRHSEGIELHIDSISTTCRRFITNAENYYPSLLMGKNKLSIIL